MNIKTFTVNPIEENCYLLWDETGEAAIVDCGAWSPSEKKEIEEFVSANRLTLRYVLQTHGHFDHVLGLPFIKEKYGLSPMINQLDEKVYSQAPMMMKEWFGILAEAYPTPSGYLTNGQVIRLGNSDIHVIHTPGHTPGGVCFYIPDAGMLLSGDTLFQFSIGRTDLPGGSYQQIIQSIKNNLMILPDETIVYPGHGSKTKISNEKRGNPYVAS